MASGTRDQDRGRLLLQPPISATTPLALQTGQVQLTQSNDIEPFDVPRFKAMPNLQVELNGWEYAQQISWIEVNHRVKPLDDVRVRQGTAAKLGVPGRVGYFRA